MMFLLLIAFLTVVGTFFAVPLFEFVFGTLLVVPVIRFLLAFVALQCGYDVPNGMPSLALYAVSFVVVVLLSKSFFGRRTTKLVKADLYPILFFAGLFTLAYQLCMLWPDFVDLGERLRDYALLATSIDSPVLPREPWMDGIKLNYYVYWYRFGNLLSTVLGMPVWEAYHVLLSLSIAFYGAVMFQIVRVIVRAPLGVAFIAGILIPFGSNVAGVCNFKRAEKGYGWETDNGWWGPSRVVQGAIDEFPSWSFVLGDAHPHFLNLATLPFFILIFYRILTSEASQIVRFTQAGLFVIAGTLFLMASNAWEVPMWLGSVAAVCVVGGFLLSDAAASVHLPSLKGKPVFEIVRGGIASVVLLAAVVGVARFYDSSDPIPSLVVLGVGIGFFAMAFPFKRPPAEFINKLLAKRPPVLQVVFWGLLFITLKLTSRHIVPDNVPLDMVRSPIPVTTSSELWMHWGIQLFFITVGSVLALRFSFASVVMVAFLALSVVYDKAALFLYSILAFQVVRLLSDKESKKRHSWNSAFEGGLTIAGLILILTPEFVFVNDSYGSEIERMNTIFKLYTTAWGLLGVASFSLIVRSFRKYSDLLTAPGPYLPAMMTGLLVLVVCGGFSNFYKNIVPKRMSGLDTEKAPGPEGLATAERWHKGAADTIRALRVLPKGRVLETQGRPYSYTAFVSTLAAQPCYLGWANHVNLLSKSEGKEVARRQKVTDDIYKQQDCMARKELAQREKISYIVVGTLERKNYPGVEGSDYSCFSSVIKTGDYALYQIPVY